jgi:putative endopeptidase
VRSFNVIHKKNELVLRKILENAEKSGKNENASLNKIGDYYSACMDEKAVDKAGLTPIKPLLDKAKHLYNPKAISAFVTELHKDGIWALFDVSSDQDFKDATRYIAYLDQDGLGLPDRDYYAKQDDKSKEIRKKYQ